MEDLYQDYNMTAQSISKSEEGLFHRALRFISSTEYELFMNIVTILNVTTVLARAFVSNQSLDQIRSWVFSELIINYLMLLESIGDILVAGPIKAFRYHYRIWPETLCQILNIIATGATIKASKNQ